ncbi:MAG: hypothetical protein M3346_05970 [Actinomycetota bacterium]|nr:hypothetical protein [Actinomycetota bacterium]
MNTKKALGKPNGHAQTGTGMKVGPAGNQTEPNSEPTPLTATGRPPGEELTPLQLAGIHALLTQPTMAAAGKEIGVSARTINRWSKQRAFRAEYLAPAVLAAGPVRALDGSCHPVDRQETEVTQQLLMVDPSKGGVIDHSLGTRDMGGESPSRALLHMVQLLNMRPVSSRLFALVPLVSPRGAAA